VRNRKDLEKVTLEYPFWVHFKGEIAIDVGGVTRDMFSAFAEAYLRLFHGACLLFPAMHASACMEMFPLLGAIISYAYLVAGVFTDRIHRQVKDWVQKWCKSHLVICHLHILGLSYWSRPHSKWGSNRLLHLQSNLHQHVLTTKDCKYA